MEEIALACLPREVDSDSESDAKASGLSSKSSSAGFKTPFTDGGFGSEPALVSEITPSSYWSVSEQTKFPQLVAYFGTDWEAIANFMKSKTISMVRVVWLLTISR